MNEQHETWLKTQIARAYDVPLWVVGIGEPPPPDMSPRARLSRALYRLSERVERVGWAAVKRAAYGIDVVADWIRR